MATSLDGFFTGGFRSPSFGDRLSPGRLTPGFLEDELLHELEFAEPVHARDTFYETRRTASELDDLRALAERGDVQFPAIPADALLREGEGGVISIWDTVVRELAGFDVCFFTKMVRC